LDYLVKICEVKDEKNNDVNIMYCFLTGNNFR